MIFLENINNLSEDLLFEMATIQKADTGLPYELWLDPMGVKRGNEHSGNPRLKVRVDDTLVPVEICDDPQIPDSVANILGKDFIKKFAVIKKYMQAYKEILLAHYYRKISDRQVTDMLLTLGKAAESLDRLHKLLDKERISNVEFYWKDDEAIFAIDLKNSSDEIIGTRYAFDDSELSKELNALKFMYGNNIKIIKK